MSSPGIPRESTVLVTGISGYIGSHIGDQLLTRGYRVRGAVRSEDKANMVREIYKERHGLHKLEFVLVPELGENGAFDDAVKGCSGIVHVASILNLSPDPNAVVPPTLNSVDGLLNAAAKEPSVKRFVLTSSAAAAAGFVTEREVHIDSSSWNTKAVEEAWEPPPYEPSRAMTVYSASKTQAEQACFDFVKSRKPGFVLNTVLPYSTFGEILDPGQSASSSGRVRAAWNGEAVGLLASLPPRWFVDVKDVARLHVAGLVEDDVQNERLLAYGEKFNFNDLMRLLRKLGPDRKIPRDIEDQSRDLSTVDRARSIELLKRMGRSGFTGLEESIKQLVGL